VNEFNDNIFWKPTINLEDENLLELEKELLSEENNELHTINKHNKDNNDEDIVNASINENSENYYYNNNFWKPKLVDINIDDFDFS